MFNFNKPWPNGLPSSREMNMCSDLRSGAKWTHRFLRQQTKVEKTYFKANISCITLANNMLTAPLDLGWVAAKP